MGVNFFTVTQRKIFKNIGTLFDCREKVSVESVDYKTYKRQEVEKMNKKITENRIEMYKWLDRSLQRIGVFVKGLNTDLKEETIEIEKEILALKHVAVVIDLLLSAVRKLHAFSGKRLLTTNTFRHLYQKIALIGVLETFLTFIVEEKKKKNKWPNMKNDEEKEIIMKQFILKEKGLKKKLMNVTGF